ncbi:hypothetical protein B0H10DRAFT_2220522 [Mycena sp. CBHHK59/15]|nr:hypothetical protein B0H10DRAFT_2220522 [Mycena sp. CBHHK59/15]
MRKILVKYDDRGRNKLLPKRGTLFASRPEVVGANWLKWTLVNLALCLFPSTTGLFAFCSLLSCFGTPGSNSPHDVVYAFAYFSVSAGSALSFTANFRTKNAQLFSDTSWVDLDDLRAWIRGRGDLDHLLDPPVSESNFPPVVGLGPDSLYGMDGSVGNTTFNTYPAVNFDRPRSATPSSGYSFHPYDDHQSSNHSRPSSEFEYLSASGISTPYSGLPLFGDNVSEPNLDWDHSLAAFFDSMDTGSGSDLSFLPPDNVSFPVLGSDPTDMTVASGSDMFCFHQNASHVVALNPTAFLPPPQEPQENFKFDDGNPRLMTHEEMDEAGEAWQWVRSDTVWLDQDVSCDVYIPPEPFPVTKGFKVVRIERVHGIPSQFPVPLVPTAYIVHFSSVRDSYKNEDGEMNNLDKILKDKDCHSWDGTPAERTSSRAPMVHGQLFASIGNFTFVQCRWSRQNCQGIHYCESIDPSLINVERFELDPHARDAVNNAQIMQRLNQELPSRRKYYFACSNYSSSWKNHSGIQIPPDVDEDLCIRLFRGDSIVGAFSHSKDGKAYIASMLKLICAAGTTFLVPLDEENVPVVIVIPQHNRPHTHPPPPDTKVPGHVKALYEQAIRAFAVSIATVNKVDQAASTIQIMGRAPGLVHPSLLHAPTKQAIISALKRREPGGDKSGWEGLFDIYKADQEKDPKERYMHSFDFLPGRSPPSAGFLALKTREEVQEFSDWFFSLDIKPITAWWNHKLNHKWILPGLLECLSGLYHEDWITTPFTSNGNETQHHWTNSQTGIGLPARECILRAAKADHAVGEQFNGQQPSKSSYRAQREVKELKAELAILMAEMKTSSSGVVRVTQKSKAKSLAKDAAARNKAPKKRSIDERELDGIQMSSPDVRVETGIQSDAFEQENDGDASQYEPAIPMILDTVDDGMVISLSDSNVAVPSVSPPAPSPISPHFEPPAPLSIRRSSRKRGASKTHDDAPAPKSKKTEGAAAAPEASNSGKTRRVACPHS